MPAQQPAISLTFGEARLDALQRRSFDYFLRETNPENGLVADKSQPGSPASIAAVGFALAAYPVGVERGWMTRTDAVTRTLALLRFFWASPQGTAFDATGHKGFYYHFLDLSTGRRAGLCELSTIDSTFLFAGMLAAAAYFDHEDQDEQAVRTLADALYRRADWPWACNGAATVTHGWTPEGGFLPYRWSGYDEATLLYVLGLGSPTHPLPAESYTAWTSTYKWKTIYGHELLYGGPLFVHQYSHIWLDMRGIQDAFARDKGIDYSENSRRATYVQREYPIRNPLDFAAHGAPYGPDDGTVAPWAVAASLPFAPEIVLPSLQHFQDVYPQVTGEYCFRCSFNLSFPDEAESDGHAGWTSPYHFGINLGPVVLMCENHRSDFLWRLIRACPYVVAGLRRAGFANGWL